MPARCLLRTARRPWKLGTNSSGGTNCSLAAFAMRASQYTLSPGLNECRLDRERTASSWLSVLIPQQLGYARSVTSSVTFASLFSHGLPAMQLHAVERRMVLSAELFPPVGGFCQESSDILARSGRPAHWRGESSPLWFCLSWWGCVLQSGNVNLLSAPKYL